MSHTNTWKNRTYANIYATSKFKSVFINSKWFSASNKREILT